MTQLPHPRPATPTPARTPRRRVWAPLVAVLVAAAVLASCSSSDDEPATAPDRPGTQAPVTTGAPAPNALSVEDLAAMTVPQAELGDVAAGLVFDWFFGGYEDNEERARDKSGDPEGERDDLERTGRLAGYLDMYVPPEQQGEPRPGVQRVFTAAHLFRDAGGAASYLGDADEEARREVGAQGSDGAPPEVTARREFPVEGIGDEAFGSVSEGSAGTTTRIAFRRDRVLGIAQVLRDDRRDDRADVERMARRLDERIGTVLSGKLRAYAGGADGVVPVEALTAMPLPKAALPGRYTRFGDDVVVGRFQDNEERLQTSSLDPDDDRDDDRRFGRVVGYHGAYSSEFGEGPPSPPGFVRSGVEVFRDEGGASAWLADEVEDQRRLAGRTARDLRVRSVEGLAAPVVGDEAYALVLRTSIGDVVTVLFRRGRLVGSVVLGPPGGPERTDEAARLGAALDERIRSTLAGTALGAR